MKYPSIAYNKKIGKEVKKSIRSYVYGNFPAPERYNETFTRHEPLDVTICSMANDCFTDKGSELLKIRSRKIADGDTVFYRTKPATISQVLSYYENVNEKILTTAKSLELLNKPYTCGLDWHNIGLCSKKIKKAVRKKRKDGTEYALRYLSIESAEEGRRFIFHPYQ